MPQYEAIGNAYTDLVDQYSVEELQLICDYMEKASLLAQQQLANMSGLQPVGLIHNIEAAPETDWARLRIGGLPEMN